MQNFIKNIPIVDTFQGGIYKITNLRNNRIYIGSTINFYKRCKSHYDSLDDNRHANNFLQHDFLKTRKLGFDFVFDVVEVVKEVRDNIELLLEREQEWIDKHYDDQEQCYNFARIAAKSRVGCFSVEDTPKSDRRRRTRTPEEKQKVANSVREFYKNYGSEHLIQKLLENWSKKPANITLENVDTGEIVFIDIPFKRWCRQRKLNYRAMHLLTLGQERGTYISQGWKIHGQADWRLPASGGFKGREMPQEYRDLRADPQFIGTILYHEDGRTLTVPLNTKQFAKDNELDYSQLRRVLKQSEGQTIVNGWRLTPTFDKKLNSVLKSAKNPISKAVAKIDKNTGQTLMLYPSPLAAAYKNDLPSHDAVRSSCNSNGKKSIRKLVFRYCTEQEKQILKNANFPLELSP